ncbi:MAG: diacylglycerol kinase family lipid kinase [Lactovum sp.]
MKARLIYNPTSGQEIIKKYIADILEKLESYGYETSAFATTVKKDSAKNEAKRVSNLDFDLIVAAGGDGTLNEVINGIMQIEESRRPQLAILPTGTTNDFARALKIPRNKPLRALEVIEKKQILNIDIGYVKNNESYFINIAAGGALTELTYSVPSQLKTIFGYLAYLSKGAELLPRVKKQPVRIHYDGQVIEEDISMFFCALTNSVGGFERIAPDALLNDGRFTLILVKTDNIFDLIALFSMIASGSVKHVEDKNIIYIKASSVTIEPLNLEKWMVNLDGEYGGLAPVYFENKKRAIEMFVNLDEVSDENYEEELEDDHDLVLESYTHKFVEEVRNLTERQVEKNDKIE